MNFNFFSSERREFLCAFGWSPYFDQQLSEEEIETTVAVRVIGEERELYRVQLTNEITAFVIISGRMRYQSIGREDFPAVGDWVLLSLDDVVQISRDDLATHQARFTVRRILARRTALMRKQVGKPSEQQIIAANVDYVFIATSMNQDFNLRRLDRYIAMTEQSGAVPVILMTKCDLSASPSVFIEQVAARFPQVMVKTTSMHDTLSLNAIYEIAQRGTTSVIVGSSGVGKSTLINHLMNAEVLQTQQIRTSDEKGKHTTTARYLMATEQGALFIDTPGMREIQFLSDDGETNQAGIFSDIVNLITACRFSDCQHQSEPGCAIRKALDEGALESDRWWNYLKMMREQGYRARKGDIVAQSKERERWKKIQVSLRQKYKIEKS